jgi:Fur family transcriptional regulator, stress-responsive regulator
MSTPTQSPLDADIADVIRDAGLKLTKPRGAVLKSLIDHPHASADEVLSRVTTALPKASLQSVYNALSDFVAAGIVRRFEPAGSPGLYELRVADNHHHLVCTECGAVVDVDCAVGHAPCLTPSEAHGFAVHEAEVTYWGLCAACASAAIPVTPVQAATPTQTTTG